MDKVHTVDAIHDGCPLKGIADYLGHPHFYERQFDDEADDWSDRYVLKRIDADLFALAIELQGIFLDWRKALDTGEVSSEAYPVLTRDNPRFNKLQDILAKQVAALPEAARAIGRFGPISRDSFTGNVRWEPF